MNDGMQTQGWSRRNFLKSAAASGVLIMGSGSALGSEANGKLEIGIIGTGQRGTWIGHLFEEFTDSKVVAVHDYFKMRADQAGELLDVPEERRYYGLDGYQALLESGVDAVAIETPTYFHTEQAVAALEAGVHVFLAKPVAGDVWGCHAILEAAEKRRGQCSCLVDFQTRNDPAFREAVQRVHDGQIGDPLLAQAYYHTDRLGLKGHTEGETGRLINWYFDKALSGDIIVEQNVHVIDVANWFMNAHPVRATGRGGRVGRTDIGDCWDHFVVTYEYPDGQLLDFGSNQFAPGFGALTTRVFGQKGSADTHYGGQVKVVSRDEYWDGGLTNQIYQQGVVNNMIDFHAGIMSGDYVDTIEDGVNSTLTAILGRMAAYEERTVTWDEMLASSERLDPALDLPEDGPLENPRPVT